MGLGQLLTRAATGQRVTVTPVTDGVEGTPTSMFIATNNLNALAGGGGVSSWDAGMGIPAAARATILIADLLAALPYVPFRERWGQPPERLPTPPVLEQPHPPELAFDTLASLVMDYLWNGNGVAVITARDAEARPTAYSPRPAPTVKVGRDSATNRVTYQTGPTTFYDYTDVLHLKGPCKPGELVGKGVLQWHLETLTLARDQRRQATSITRHGVPTGLIRSTDPKMTPAKAAGLKADWMTAQETRTPMVLNPQTDFEPIAWNPEELQLVEARKMSTEDIALIFGLPGSYLNVPNASRTYTSVPAENLQLLRFSSVRGHLARLEGVQSALLPRGTRVRADLDETLLRPDIIARYELYRGANPAGVFLSTDEIRALEGRPPLTPAQRAAARPPAPPATPGQQEEGQGDA